jgi:hypothetical protein
MLTKVAQSICGKVIIFGGGTKAEQIAAAGQNKTDDQESHKWNGRSSKAFE